MKEGGKEMKRLLSVLAMAAFLVAGWNNVEAKQCQLNKGAYIAHSKANIVKAMNNLGQLREMANHGELRKLGGGPFRITVLYADDKYVKFAISIAPGKEIWTLAVFTQGCN